MYLVGKMVQKDKEEKIINNWGWFNSHLYHDFPLVVNTVNHHLQRYVFALTSMEDSCNTALDIGCGSGYGSHILRTAILNVYGIDIDFEAIDYAKKHYPLCNFEQISLKNVLNSNKKFDFVTCFEFIEHLKKDDGFDLLMNIGNIVNKFLFISTPVDAKLGVNPRHLSSWNEKELNDCLSKDFSNVYFFYQDWSSGLISKVYNKGFIVCVATKNKLKQIDRNTKVI